MNVTWGRMGLLFIIRIRMAPQSPCSAGGPAVPPVFGAPQYGTHYGGWGYGGQGYAGWGLAGYGYGYAYSPATLTAHAGLPCKLQ
jgi:hypothetical protein